MSSPLVSVLAEKPGGEIVGKDALRAYFAAGLEKYPALHFEPLALFVGVNSLVLHYRSASGQPAAEVVFLDEQGQNRPLRRPLRGGRLLSQVGATDKLANGGARRDLRIRRTSWIRRCASTRFVPRTRA